jgi:hypothetical protein
MQVVHIEDHHDPTTPRMASRVAACSRYTELERDPSGWYTPEGRREAVNLEPVWCRDEGHAYRCPEEST